MIVTTTQNVDGRKVEAYLGVVTAIVGANIFKDLFAGIRDIVGGRGAAYDELRKAREDRARRIDGKREAAQPPTPFSQWT